MMVHEHRLSRAKACRIAGLSRAALYRESTDRIERDAPVVQALKKPSSGMGAGVSGSASSDYAIRAMRGITNVCIGCTAA
jgi:hypothetical protein